MRLLKKASIRDILKEDRENVTIHYKEIELYVSLEDIDKFDTNKLKKLIEQLNKNNANISAIHCPESRYKTSSDKSHQRSSNYLSICEAIKDEESQENLKKIIGFTEKIYIEQWDINKGNRNESETEFDGEDTENEKTKRDKILLIVHSGCEIGCQKNFEYKECTCTIPKDCVKKEFKSMLKNDYVQIVIENITPYLDENDLELTKGQNCGWSNDKSWNCFKLAKELDVGVCVDVCHILASYHIMNNHSNYSNAIDEYLKYIRDNEFQSKVLLFHLANYDETGIHGAQFNDTDFDNELLEKIRSFCFEIAPTALTTLEVADGQDYEKACRNFDRLMLKLSERHTSGLIAAILNKDKNKDLKQYFDDLYFSYASRGNDIFELRKRATRIKKYIVSNTYNNQERSQINHPFNFSKESNKYDTALFRMQAYIYYTRFCNLARFLADNYYNEDSVIYEADRAEDFALSLKYFMFNDDVKQIEYTGVAFRFNVDWLPQKDTFFRFFDGINEAKFEKELKKNPMPHIVEMIRVHVQGDCCLFSCGRNFGICLFKYLQPVSTPDSWTIRIYEDAPINFFEYENRKYSIPAFMQLTRNDEIDFTKIKNFSFDISRFHEGRGDEKSNGKNASSLFSLFRYYTNNISSVERTGSINDGEIVFLQLPRANLEYAFSEKSIVVLFKAYLMHISSKEDITENDLNGVVNKLNGLNIEDITESGNLNCTDDVLSKLKEQTINQQEIGNIKQLLSKVRKTEKNDKNERLKQSPYDSSSKQIIDLFKRIENQL